MDTDKQVQSGSTLPATNMQVDEYIPFLSVTSGRAGTLQLA